MANRVHWDYGPLFCFPCGLQRLDRPCTSESSDITCRNCRRQWEVAYASKRDGVDYRFVQDDARRARAADKRAAQHIVLNRHSAEVEEEFALQRLARLARDAGT